MASPESVTSLVLVDAATGDGRPGGRGGPLAGAAPFLLELPPLRRLAQHVIRRVVTPGRLAEILGSAYLDPGTVTPETEAGYLAQIRTPDWDLALLAVVRDGQRSALPRPLSTLDVPVIVIWGAGDPWIPLASGEAIRDAIPGAALAVIPGAGHLPFEEQPDAFMTSLLPFLEAHP
jgi:pimeloyl-ACP methyl ester carboxylesterase